MNKKTFTPSDSQELVTKFFLKIQLNEIIEIINQQHISTGNQINKDLDKINNKIYDLQRQLDVHNQKEYDNITKEEPAEFKLKTTSELTRMKTTLENIEKTKEAKRWRIETIISIIALIISIISPIIITIIAK